MRRMGVVTALLAMLFTAFIPAPADEFTTDPGDAIIGVWNTTDAKSRVQIFRQNNKYYAKIISLKEPNIPAGDPGGKGGRPKTDYKNPNPKLRDRPIVGLQFMHDFVYAGRNLWDAGKVYDPENGKTYKCKMTLVSTNRLEVHGYVGVSLLGRTVTWTR